jgi:hypothetical protein
LSSSSRSGTETTDTIDLGCGADGPLGPSFGLSPG